MAALPLQTELGAGPIEGQYMGQQEWRSELQKTSEWESGFGGGPRPEAEKEE